MKWADPSISLVICGLQDDCDWNTEAVKKLHGIADYISAHHYAVGWGPFTRNDYLQNLYIPQYMERINEMVLASIIVGQNDSDHRIQVAWDEWNLFGWVVPGVNDDASYNLQNVIVTASVLNFFIRHCQSVGMANYSTFLNINGAVSVKPDGLMLRPQFYAFEMLANGTGTTLVDTFVRSGAYDAPIPPRDYRRPAPRVDALQSGQTGIITEKVAYIDAVTTTDAEGNVYLSLINKHLTEDIDVEIAFYGDEVPAGMAQVQTIWSPDVWDANTADEPNKVVMQDGENIPAGAVMHFTAKAHSVNLLKMRKA